MKRGNNRSFPEMQGSVLLQLPSSCHLHLLEWPTPVTDEKWMWDLTDLFLSSWSCITRQQQAVSFVGPSSLDLCTLSHCNSLTYYPIHKRIRCWLAVWHAVFCDTAHFARQGLFSKHISFPNLLKWGWLAKWKVLQFFRLKVQLEIQITLCHRHHNAHGMRKS